VTVESVKAACEAAKKAKPNESIPTAYVLSILERWAKEAAELKATGAAPPHQVNGHARSEPFDPVAHVNRNRRAP